MRQTKGQLNLFDDSEVGYKPPVEPTQRYRSPAISPSQFGPLYHGTSYSNAVTLDQRLGGGPRYTAMRNSYGYNYATTNIDTAKDYAQAAADRDTGASRSGRVYNPHVYEVAPQRQRDEWGPDPDSGPGGWHDGPETKRDALDISESGGHVDLRFASPLRVIREVKDGD